MCGLAGLWNWCEDSSGYPHILEDMLWQLRHRGPTDSGGFFDHRMGFAASRLAIFDPNQGAQPFSDPGRSCHLIYNGALYNHEELRQELEGLGFEFLTHCDTEVVLRSWLHWGASAFERFNGMFALALYEQERERLVLARDPWGQKPLFYTAREEGFAFASEIKAFLALPQFSFSWDPAELAFLYHCWTPAPDSSPFAGVKQVPPGSSMTLEPGQPPRLQTYHEFPLNSGRPGPLQGYQQLIKSELERAVGQTLRSGSKVGTYLSGGLDSTLITALATQMASKKVHTYSLSFPDHSAFDERQKQKAVVDALGTEHTPVEVSGEAILMHFPDSLYHGETPVVRTALTPMYLLSRAVKDDGVRVVLSGEGADELFLGYQLFAEADLRARWPILTQEQRRDAISKLYPYEQHLDGNPLSLFPLLASYSSEASDLLFSHRLRTHNSRLSLRLLGVDPSQPNARLRSLVERGFPEAEDSSVLRRAQWLEFQTFLGGYLLSSQGDRAAMAHGVEARYPFLDRDLSELALEVPLEFHAPLGHKRLLRGAFAGLLSPKLLRERKTPYRSPGAELFLRQAPDYLDTVLSPGQLRSTGLFSASLVEKFLSRLRTRGGKPVGPREQQAFFLLLSTAILDQLFCQRKGLRRRDQTVIRWKA